MAAHGGLIQSVVVDRMREGRAQLGIVEWWRVHVPLQELPVSDRSRFQHNPGALLNRQHVGGRKLIDLVDLSGQQALHADDRSGEVLHEDELAQGAILISTHPWMESRKGDRCRLRHLS